MVHLATTAQALVALGHPWAFTDRHAEPPDAEYAVDLAHLERLRWDILHSNDWGGDLRRPFKQAEFLVYDHVPWSAFAEVGVMSAAAQAEVQAVLGPSDAVRIRLCREWYYP